MGVNSAARSGTSACPGSLAPGEASAAPPGPPGSAPITVGIAYWRPDDGVEASISASLEELGFKAVRFPNGRLDHSVDVVLAYGPNGSMVPLGKQLLACPRDQRPLLVLWMSEQLPNPATPEWINYALGVSRSAIERRATRLHGGAEWRLDPRFRWVAAKGFRFRYYGDLYWLRQHEILSVLVVQSRWLASFLHARGFNPLVAHLGAPPSWGRDLQLRRDIPVLWLGTIATERRRRLLNRVRAELRERGVEVLVIDGVENPKVFDEERTVLFNRAQIALNLLRAPWDDNSLRYTLAAPNRALIVTEPTLPHSPFLPGQHLVEAPIDKLADTICYYLSRPEEREQIVERAYRLVTDELTMTSAVAQMMKQIAAIRKGTTVQSTVSGQDF